MDLSGIEQLTKQLFSAQKNVLKSITDEDEKQKVQELIDKVNAGISNFENIDPNKFMSDLTKEAQAIHAKKD
jgi:hypothetical protein